MARCSVTVSKWEGLLRHECGWVGKRYVLWLGMSRARKGAMRYGVQVPMGRDAAGRYTLWNVRSQDLVLGCRAPREKKGQQFIGVT